MADVVTIGDATLYHGDCREILPTLPKADAVITDPPYGINYDVSASDKTSRLIRPRKSGGRLKFEQTTRVDAFPHVLGDDRPFDPSHILFARNAVLWGANHYADKLPASPCWFAWDKKLGKAADSNIGDCELAWTRGLPFKTVRCFRHMWAGFQRDSQVGAERLHPTEKPIALMQWCISFFPAAKAVADPYMGSGTTGVACVNLGRTFFGIELDRRYFDIACERIDNAYRQARLFA